jgi:hypothetical protein
MKKILLFIVLICFSYCARSQESHGGIPRYFDKNLNLGAGLKSNRGFYCLPYLDNSAEAISAELVKQEQPHLRQNYYGKLIFVDIDLLEMANVIDINGGKLYLLKIESETAFGLQFFLDKFKIPEGGELFIFNEAGTDIMGSFNNKNNQLSGKFSTHCIEGNKIYLEYFEPKSAKGKTKLHIDRISHVFKDIFLRSDEDVNGPGQSAECNINALCENGFLNIEEWHNQIRSIVLLQIPNNVVGLTHSASGVLLNNTLNDGTPYLLTASHVIHSNDVDPADMVFVFNYQDPNCSNPNPSIISQKESVNGASILSKDPIYKDFTNHALYTTSDYLLLKLNTSLATLKRYGAVYAGWDNSYSGGVYSHGTVYIGHPKGDVKKIAHDAHQPLSCDWYGNLGKTEDFLRVSWDYGITEEGSSGSPLFNKLHQVIGHLSHGDSDCNNPGEYDYFGFFYTSYKKGWFARWLDPLSLNTTFLSKFDPNVDESGTGSSSGSSNGNNWVVPKGWLVGPRGILSKDDESDASVKEEWVNLFEVDIDKLQAAFPNVNINEDEIWMRNIIANSFEELMDEINDPTINSSGIYTNTVAMKRLFTDKYGKCKIKDYYEPDIGLWNKCLYPVDLRHIASSQTIYTALCMRIIDISTCSNGICTVFNFDYLPYIMEKVDVVDCNQEDLILPTQSIFDGYDCTPTQYKPNLTVGNGSSNIELLSSQNKTLKAFNSITLKNGFEAKSGSKLSASIFDCPPKYSDFWGNFKSAEIERNESVIFFRSAEIGFEDKDKKEFFITPNPTTGKLIFKTSIEELKHVTIFNIAGTLIYDKMHLEQQFEIDLQNQTKGVYLIKITSGNNTNIKKVVLQ